MRRQLISGVCALVIAAGVITATGTAGSAEGVTCTTMYKVGIATDHPIVMPWGSRDTECYLAQGNVGNGVKALQTALKYCHGYSLGGAGVDGNFGPATKTALVSFQRSKGLSADGIYGPNTMQAMKFSSEVPVSGSFSCHVW
ncbi:peptidoglycan-binding domain-containing protein [Cellulomonas sp. URHB0016]